MVRYSEKGAGGLWPRGTEEGMWQRGYGSNRMAGVAASEPGAKEKHSVPRVWPWCKETKSMARERRAMRGRLTERITRVGVPGLMRTGAQGERRAGARGCDPQGV